MTRGQVGPLSLLAASIVPVAGAVAIDSAAVGAIAVAVQLAALGWLVRDAPATLRLAAFGLVAAVSITATTWIYGGRHVDESLAAGFRILYIVLPSALLMPSLRPSELGDHLAQRVGLPARGAVACLAALQRLDGIAEQWRQIQRARRARGLGTDGGPVRRVRHAWASAFTLLVVSMRQTGAMAVAMDARGFASAHDRTWAQPAPWTPMDTLVSAIAVALAALPWILAAR